MAPVNHPEQTMQSPNRPALLLKARPTPTQLADRFRDPEPDGVELYLDVRDVSGSDWREHLERAWKSTDSHSETVALIEGPIRSLDGAYFDLTRAADADHDLIHRLLAAAKILDAQAINIHCIAPRFSAESLAEPARDEALAAALPFVRWFAAACAGNGVQPLIENIPPVGRMREAAFVYTPIGVEPRDLCWFAANANGLGITLDTSHAQLYINAATGQVGVEADRPALQSVVATYARRPHPANLGDYVEQVAGCIRSAHISNAHGLLGEGLPYGEGDVALDPIVRSLATHADFLVTEPLEPDPNRAVLMRDCWQRMRSALGAGHGDRE
ncbi:MAG: hypothetical protein CL878_04165 [Dehalococcoidia bacterium]|nr:hypothetical protein [Dehalococcoidia bacterium]